MDAMHVQAYLAIPMPSPEQDQKFRVRLYDTLDELCLLSTKLPFNLFEFGLHNPEIRLLKGKDRNQKQIRARIPFKVLRYREILRFSAEVPLLAEESVRVIPDIRGRLEIRLTIDRHHATAAFLRVYGRSWSRGGAR